jgi:hypothetical protein
MRVGLGMGTVKCDKTEKNDANPLTLNFSKEADYEGVSSINVSFRFPNIIFKL